MRAQPYPSDLTDAQRTVIGPSIPPPVTWGDPARPTAAGSIDSQAVKATEIGGPVGYDGGKRLNGRKRHMLVRVLPVAKRQFPARIGRISRLKSRAGDSA